MSTKSAPVTDPPKAKKIRQLIKIALPHVALYVLIFWYLMAGAWAFARIENAAERLQQWKKLSHIESVYKRIAEEMIDECRVQAGDQDDFTEQVYESLSR
ncbi:Protein TWK-47 [Aphelenchoides avenae]|nr:Protein TWK-47 [Aphelenchus avenae]